MSIRDRKKRKMIEEISSGRSREGLLSENRDVPHDTRVDLNLPNKTSLGSNIKASGSLRKRRETTRTPGMGIREEAPSKRRRCDGTGKGKAKPNDLALNSPKKGETSAIKRKREEKQDFFAGAKVDRPSGKMMAKKPRQDGNPQPTAKGSVQSATISSDATNSLSLKRFAYHRKIGSGSFGEVILVCDAVSRRRLAVKILEKRSLLNGNKTAAAHDEKLVLQIASRNPFLCGSYATLQTAQYLLYVMDYMAGGDLAQLIKDKAPFKIHTTRDLKPSNIFLDAAGHTKIGDFGISKMNVFADNKISGYAGTLKYVAPEVILGKQYDRAVDYFSLGVIVYEMATGKYIFYKCRDRMQLRKSIVQDDPEFLLVLNRQIRDVLEHLLCKCPEDRLTFVQHMRKHHMFKGIDWMSLESGKTSPALQMKVPNSSGSVLGRAAKKGKKRGANLVKNKRSLRPTTFPLLWSWILEKHGCIH
ncbi:protein kinase C delta type-like [Eleutherodactylus coqui]|uniref:protein kinase C delta type-like n=1 Tax=Eleutherodactylus coqui TaxID=57060 RepID=UPI0034631CAD